MTKNMKDEWTSGCDCTRMNKGRSNISRSLICDNAINFFHNGGTREKSS